MMTGLGSCTVNLFPEARHLHMLSGVRLTLALPNHRMSTNPPTLRPANRAKSDL